MNDPRPIRVMIVDDHAIVRSGLQSFLKAFEDMEFVGGAATPFQALTLCDQQQPDVVLLDMMLPEMSGVEVTRLLRQKHPQLQVLALSSSNDEDLIRDALAAGAIGYLLKTAEVQEMALAIRSAYQGKSSLSPEAAHALVRAAVRPPTPHFGLTERELEVLRLIVAGQRNSEIATTLTVTLHTVKFHVSAILHKMNVETRTEAVALALESGLI